MLVPMTALRRFRPELVVPTLAAAAFLAALVLWARLSPVGREVRLARPDGRPPLLARTPEDFAAYRAGARDPAAIDRLLDADRIQVLDPGTRVRVTAECEGGLEVEVLDAGPFAGRRGYVLPEWCPRP